ncbi:hypothetical protein AB0D13_02595 [Streptomyces sp. NPDC048430]|uniref:hypothetical protein n=1 Tax=Streptomyces sp. NPDC048430 TaxID=3155388 RepID=UPI00342022F9
MSVSSDYRDADPAEVASDEQGVSTQPAQTPPVRPPVSQEAMSATEGPVPADQSQKAATEAPKQAPKQSPAPAPKATATLKAKQAPKHAKPKPKADAGKKIAAKPAPAPATSPNIFVIQGGGPEAYEVTVPDDHDAWDDFGDFWGAFNPFLMTIANMPPALEQPEDVQDWLDEQPEHIQDLVVVEPDELQDWVEEFEPFEQPVTPQLGEVGQTPQPERHEQLKPIELPIPVIPASEEAPSTTV